MRSRVQSTDKQDIDISPLIDMVFILLIFFMVTTTFEQDHQVDLERPSAQSAERSSTKAVKVHIDESGQIYIDGVTVRPWMLQSHVRDALQNGSGKEVLVVTDRRVAVEALIEVVDHCRLAGATHVGVATRQEAG